MIQTLGWVPCFKFLCYKRITTLPTRFCGNFQWLPNIYDCRPQKTLKLKSQWDKGSNDPTSRVGPIFMFLCLCYKLNYHIAHAFLPKFRLAFQISMKLLKIYMRLSTVNRVFMTSSQKCHTICHVIPSLQCVLIFFPKLLTRVKLSPKYLDFTLFSQILSYLQFIQ